MRGRARLFFPRPRSPSFSYPPYGLYSALTFIPPWEREGTEMGGRRQGGLEKTLPPGVLRLGNSLDGTRGGAQGDWSEKGCEEGLRRSPGSSTQMDELGGPVVTADRDSVLQAN